MGDAFEILQVSRPATSTKLKAPVARSKKGDGLVPREVAGLVGEDHPFVLPSFVPTQSNFKEKRKRDKPVHWYG